MDMPQSLEQPVCGILDPLGGRLYRLPDTA